MKYFQLLIALILFNCNSVYAQSAKASLIGFYNLENLFDTIDAPEVLDEEFLPGGKNAWTGAKYKDKLHNMARVISELGAEISPDGVGILGVSEIENRSVLEDLVKEPALISRQYKIVHFDSPDKRGVDVGLLYQAKYFTVTGAESVPLIIYGATGNRVYTRDILHVTGQMDGNEVHVLVNHWPSRRGGEAGSAPLRNAAATKCRMIFDSLAQANPDVNFIVMGDFNDDPTDPSLKHYLKAKGSVEKVRPGELYNPMLPEFKAGRGTLAHNDAWSLFDQIVISYGLLKGTGGGYKLYKTEIFNKKFLIQKSGNFVGYPFRTFDNNTYINGYSDHFPVYLVFTKPL